MCSNAQVSGLNNIIQVKVLLDNSAVINILDFVAFPMSAEPGHGSILSFQEFCELLYVVESLLVFFANNHIVLGSLSIFSSHYLS